MPKIEIKPDVGPSAELVREARDMIKKHLESLSPDDNAFLNRLRKRAERCKIELGIYKGQYYLQHFDDTQPYLFDKELNHIDLFLAGYIEGSKK